MKTFKQNEFAKYFLQLLHADFVFPEICCRDKRHYHENRVIREQFECMR